MGCRYKIDKRCTYTYSPYYGRECNDFLEAVCIYRSIEDSRRKRL